MTNYDRIKSMSVEEMAFWIAGLTSETARGIDGKIIKTDTVRYYEQWLLQEVSENE